MTLIDAVVKFAKHFKPQKDFYYDKAAGIYAGKERPITFDIPEESKLKAVQPGREVTKASSHA